MRTTLAIDDDVLAAAKEMASSQCITIGEVISSLARRALQPENMPHIVRNGIPLLPVGSSSTRVTSELIYRLEQDLP